MNNIGISSWHSTHWAGLQSAPYLSSSLLLSQIALDQALSSYLKFSICASWFLKGIDCIKFDSFQSALLQKQWTG